MGLFITLFVVNFLALLTPGPDALLVVRTAASSPLRAAIYTVIGVTIGLMVWAGLAITGLQLIFERFAWLQTALKLLGGMYLLYMGVQLWRATFSKPSGEQEEAPSAVLSNTSAFRAGLITTLANPNAMIYFSSIFVTFLTSETSVGTRIGLFTMVILESFAVFGTLAVLLSRPAPQRIYKRAISWIDPAAGTMFGVFGIRLLLTLHHG